MATRRTYTLILATLILPICSQAETRLSVVRSDDTRAKVVLSNDGPVAAIQFTIQTEGIWIQEISQGSRLLNSGWQFSFHQTSENSVNVIAYRSDATNLPSGEGVIADVMIRGTQGRITLSRVVVSGPNALSISAVVTDLEWQEQNAIIAELGQNYPNPFNPATTIPYTIERETEVTLVVYDMAGRQIRRVAEGVKQAGGYTALWNGMDEQGFQVPSGTYLVQLRAGSVVQTKKMILMQ